MSNEIAIFYLFCFKTRFRPLEILARVDEEVNGKKAQIRINKRNGA